MNGQTISKTHNFSFTTPSEKKRRGKIPWDSTLDQTTKKTRHRKFKEKAVKRSVGRKEQTHKGTI